MPLKNPPAATPEGRLAERLTAIEQKSNTLEQRIGNPTTATGYRNGALTIGSGGAGAYTKVGLDAVIHDPGKHIEGGLYIVPSEGFYLVVGSLSVNIETSKAFRVSIFINEGELVRAEIDTPSYTSNQVINVSVMEKLKANDKIELYGFANAASALNVGTSIYNRLEVTKIS
jgi:hypothetical protein